MTQDAVPAPRRRPWATFIRGWALLLSLGLIAAGLILALIPVSYPGQSLLSSAIAGAGIAGLLAEFTICFDRREDDFDLQVQRQRYTALEGQVGRVDDLVRKTRIVVVNQMFKLGIDLYQTRFLPPDQAAAFRAEAVDLAAILQLTPAVSAFLASPYLRASDGLPPPGQDPFPPLKAAARLRYARDAAEALAAGSVIGTVMNTAGGLVDDQYRATTVRLLREAFRRLYLLPPVLANLDRALRGLAASAYPYGYFGGYMTLFSFYLSYRMTGDVPEVAPLFEQPLSLAGPAGVARVSGLLAKLSGQPDRPPSPGTPQAAPAQTGSAPAVTGQQVTAQSIPAAQAGDESAGTAAPAPWYRFIRIWAVVFWLVVAIAGLTGALGGWTFPAQDLLTSGLAGAGIAGLLSELTFCADRRQTAQGVRDQRERYDELHGHLDQVDDLVRKSEVVAVSQLCRLGIDLSWVRFAPADQVAGFLTEARELAGALGMSAPVEQFLASPYLRPSEPLAPDQDPYPALREAASRRYARAGLEALRTGGMLGILLQSGLGDPHMVAETARVLKQSVRFLHLEPAAAANMLAAVDDVEHGRCPLPLFGQYLMLFSAYLTHRMTDDRGEVAALFEAPVSLAEAATSARIHQVLALLAGQPEDAPAASAPG